MKPATVSLFACVFALITVVGNCRDAGFGQETDKNERRLQRRLETAAEGSEEEKEGQNTRRRLQGQLGSTGLGGPCAGFNFTQDRSSSCSKIQPKPNPDVTQEDGLSLFAQQWIEYTCCNIVKEPLSGIIASVWLWLQVCTKAMNEVLSRPEKMARDLEFADEKNIRAYAGGPLHNMKHYCPSDLDGGELTEWVVATFFPVMERHNEHFKASQTLDRYCSAKPTSGAVTVLLAEPSDRGTFGHISMVLHDNDKLDLPKDLNNEHYVSFSNHRDAIGVMITGTKADHVKFGHDLNVVNKTLTLYNANVTAMLKKWQRVKESGQMFDLLEWNCARTLLEILNEGYPDCQVSLGHQLWTPNNVFSYITQMQEVVNKDTPKGEISAKVVRSRHIDPIPPQENFPWVTVIIIGAISFFANVVLVVVVVEVVILRITESGEAKLETGLAKILLSAYSNSYNRQMASGAGTHAELQSVQSMIATEMDQNNDGKTDFEEFSSWCTKELTYPLSDKETEMVWKQLDINDDGKVDKQEWHNFILKRKNLKWLVKRISSSRRLTV